MSPSASIETYYAIGQPDFVVALAVTSDNRIPLVRQYRPAIEGFSLELPAGTVESGETAAAAAVRELFEETGYETNTIELIGQGATCAGRINNSTFSFFIRTGERSANFVEESGISPCAVTWDELRSLILSGEFAEQTHLGTLALAAARGLIPL